MPGRERLSKLECYGSGFTEPFWTCKSREAKYQNQANFQQRHSVSSLENSLINQLHDHAVCCYVIIVVCSLIHSWNRARVRAAPVCVQRLSRVCFGSLNARARAYPLGGCARLTRGACIFRRCLYSQFSDLEDS